MTLAQQIVLDQQYSSEFVVSDYINTTLKQSIGNDFSIRFLRANELLDLKGAELVEIANCYRDVFNQSWGESWTTESALCEVKDSFNGIPGRKPIATLLYKGKRVIGFAWGLLTDMEHLIASRDMPFFISQAEKEKGMAVTRHWLNDVIRKKKYIFGVNWAY